MKSEQKGKLTGKGADNETYPNEYVHETHLTFWHSFALNFLITPPSKPKLCKAVCTVMITFKGEHITDTYITDTDITELENLSHNIIDTFIFDA